MPRLVRLAVVAWLLNATVLWVEAASAGAPPAACADSTTEQVFTSPDMVVCGGSAGRKERERR